MSGLVQEEFTIEKHHPCIDGHFPGMPVVPGAYLLCCVERFIGKCFPGRVITGLKKVKFSHRLVPGVAATIILQKAPNSYVTFSIQSDGGDILSGKAVCADNALISSIS